MPRTSKLIVTSGTAKGTRLLLPPGVRPMPSRMKQAMFNILADQVTDADVLDLFAGSGSLGIEAVSRGAASATFVEKQGDRRDALETNFEKTGLKHSCTLIIGDAYHTRDLLGSDAGPFGLVFLDPPYINAEDGQQRKKLGESIAAMKASGRILPAAVFVFHARAAATGSNDAPEGLQVTDTRRYGTGILMICR